MLIFDYVLYPNVILDDFHLINFYVFNNVIKALLWIYIKNKEREKRFEEIYDFIDVFFVG